MPKPGMTSEKDDRLLSPQGLAERWDISTKTLANQRSLGIGLPYVKVGTLIRYRLSDIEAFEAENLVEPI